MSITISYKRLGELGGGMDLEAGGTPEVFKESDEKLEPEELMEEYWFFSNLLDGKPRMFRSYSDPCTSSDYEKSYDEVYGSIQKLSAEGGFPGFNLVKGASLPPSMENFDYQNSGRKGSDLKRSPSRRKASSSKILRAPSLPASLGNEEFQDEETEFSMGKLIRQASMKNHDILPPRSRFAKSLTPSHTMPRKQSTIKPEQEQEKIKRSTGIESSLLTDFESMGFDFRKKDAPNQHKISSVPSIQEDKEKCSVSRSHLSGARWAHSSAPPFPKWGGEKSSEDMKEQIRFWARAVAYNVH